MAYPDLVIDPGLLVIGLFAIVFVTLIALAIRKMARGEIHAPPPQEQLTPGEQADEAALEKEALEGPPPELPEVPEAPVAEEAAPLPKDDKAEAMRRGLEKTRKGFMSRINDLLRGRTLDENLVDELEAALVTSDIGVRTAERLLGDLRQQLTKKEISDPDAVRGRLRDNVRAIVEKPCPPLDWSKQPLVIMVIGVNGVGKTTTIGKLAARFVREGKKVVLAAGDTFRAAAMEQLEIWGQRANAEVVKGPANGDPAAVMFEAVQKALATKADVCIADTAGRLHTKVNLMEELKKLRRVMNKALPGAPHEVLLVLDATTGQNAIVQAKQFKEAVEVSSIALTKLDGTAKGGVVVAICDDLGLPVRYVGVGEKVDDLRDFDPGDFVDALFERDDAEQALPRTA
jgi:fused signal recognition particle receptor